MGKNSRLRRKKRREAKKDNSKNIRKQTLKNPFTDLYGFNTLPLNSNLPENINFMVK